MKCAGVVFFYLVGALIGGMVVFELFRLNFYPAMLWMLIAAAYLTAMMMLIDHIEDRGGFDG